MDWQNRVKASIIYFKRVFQNREKNFRKRGKNESWSSAETGNSESLDIQRNIGEENDIFNIS